MRNIEKSFTKDMLALRREKRFVHSYIAPIEYMQYIPSDKRRSCHLLLAHLLSDKRYCEYYRQRKEDFGDVIIVDNGAFEYKSPIPIESYYELIKNNLAFDVDLIVAPDYPFCNYRRTINATLEFINKYLKYFDINKTKIMAVPQSEAGDNKGWMECYKEFIKTDEISAIGLSILGVPNAFASITGTKDISTNRRFLINLLNSSDLYDESVWYHYLGCGDPREVIDMIMGGVADSNDSSSAIWHGILGIGYDDSPSMLIAGKNTTPVDFYRSYSDINDDLIKFNVSLMKSLICRLNDMRRNNDYI